MISTRNTASSEPASTRPRLARILWVTGFMLVLAFVFGFAFLAAVPERGGSERLSEVCDRFSLPERLRDFPHTGPVGWERDRLTSALTVSGRTKLSTFESWAARQEPLKGRIPAGMDPVDAYLARAYGLREGARHARAQYFERNRQVDVFIQEDGPFIIRAWRMSSR